MPPQAGSLQPSPGLEELLVPLPPIRLFAVQFNPFTAKFPSPGSLGKGKPGASAPQQSIIVSAGYFRLRFCRTPLLEKSAAGSVAGPRGAPRHSAAGRAALYGHFGARQPCLRLWRVLRGHSAGAGSLQSSVHIITYGQRNAPNGEDHKANLVQKPADDEE